MSWIKSRRFLYVGAFALFVVVGLMSFGECARHGHYHLDGGRGWDLPANASLDAGHTYLSAAVCPLAAVRLGCDITAVHGLVLPFEAPAREFSTLRVWFRLRPPPQV